MKDDDMAYLGIDPGATGGLTVIIGTGRVIIDSMPNTEHDIWEWFRSRRYTFRPGHAVAAIEKVGGYMGGEDNRWLGPAMFRFGQGYGFLRGCLAAADIPFEEVTPRTWQKGLSIPSKRRSETKGTWKNRLKTRAQQLFPQVSITLATCDALLIAEYCRRKREGRLL